MAFPSSPSDGQIYKNYKYDSTKGAWIYEPYTSKITRTKYNITDSNDVTVDLPDATNEVVERTYFRTGSGSGKVLFSTTSSQLINGLSASNWYLENEEKITLFPYEGNWYVKEYGGCDEDGNVIIKPVSERDVIVTNQLNISGASRIKATRSIAQTIPNNTLTTIIWNNVIYDNLNEYNNSTGEMTIKESGYYLINAKVISTGVSWGSISYWYIRLNKNGDTIRYGHLTYQEYDRTFNRDATLTTIEYLEKDDVIKIQLKHNRGSDTDTGSNSAENYFDVHRLS